MQDSQDSLFSIIEKQQQDHFEQGAPSLAQRRQKIYTAIQLLQENADAIIDAVNQDYGFRARDLTRYADIDSVVSTLQYAHKHVKAWMKPQKRSVGLAKWLKGERAYIDYQPLGSIGVMAPWNGPVALLFLSLAGIFAAGNRVVLKPSHQTPKTAALIQILISQYFRPEQAVVVSGDVNFAQIFASAPFNHLLYTGNSYIGAQVMGEAAKQLTPVTLELGGASPVVVGQTANLQDAVSKTLQAKMVNAGQICIAPDAVYIHESQLSQFIEFAKYAAQKLYPEGLKTTDYPALFSDEQFTRVHNLLEDAKAQQVDVIGLLTDQDCSGAPHRSLAPTLLINPSLEAQACQQEIFSPILRVHTYKQVNEVIEHIQQTQTPLALYYFGSDKAELNYLLDHSRSGGVTINDVMVHAFTPNLPFGGVGRSGMGRYGGLEGFRTFSNARAIYRKKP